MIVNYMILNVVIFVFHKVFYYLILISFKNFFFFSSRSRHTRWMGDWSSDVCSSDLGARLALRATDSLCESAARVENLVPLRNARGLRGEQRRSVTLDGDLFDPVAAADRIHHFLVFHGNDFAEHRVFAVQPRRGHVGDEELAAVGTGTGIGHGKHAGLVVFQAGTHLVLETVTRAAAARAFRAATLDHEIGDHAMEAEAVVEAALDEVHETGDRDRGLVFEQAQ